MNKNLYYQNKIRQILEKAGFSEVESIESKQGKVFAIRKVDNHTSLAIAITHPPDYKGDPSTPLGASSVNEEIRKTREYLLSHLDTKILTLCTIDDTGGHLILEKGEKIGEINRIDGVLELNLDKVIDDLPLYGELQAF